MQNFIIVKIRIKIILSSMPVFVELYSGMQNNIKLAKSRNTIVQSHRVTSRLRMYWGNIAELFLTFASNIFIASVDFYQVLQTFITRNRSNYGAAIGPRGLDSLWDYELNPKAFFTMHEVGSLKRVGYCPNSVEFYCFCRLLFKRQGLAHQSWLSTLGIFWRQNN